MPDFSRLQPDKVIETLEKLNRRINERFPDRGLGKVCNELTELAKVTNRRAKDIARPDLLPRFIFWICAALGAAVITYMFAMTPLQVNVSLEGAEGGINKGLAIVQGIEALANMVVLLGAAFLFLWTWEQRHKRSKSLKFLNELNAIIHVIDMHQLTKDPSFIIVGGPRTPSSPKREMSEFELTRYLDYCSEMLSLTAKLAAFYSQNFHDAAVNNAVADIEQLTTNLSRKIWQKIILVQNNSNSKKAF